MTRQIKFILQGARTVLVLKPAAEYVRPTKRDTHQDATRLSGDSHKLATDMRRALSYGKQINYR